MGCVNMDDRIFCGGGPLLQLPSQRQSADPSP